MATATFLWSILKSAAMGQWNEEELTELEEKVVLAELAEIKKIFVEYLQDVRNQPYIRPFVDKLRKLFRDAAKHNLLITTHARRVLKYLGAHRGTIRPYSQRVSFMTKEEEQVIKSTMNIESAILIIEQQLEHLFNMDVQHESFLGQPRQSGYTPLLLGRQAKFIVVEMDRIINAVKGLIAIEENLKNQFGVKL